jgi:hypothetical protein
LGGNSVLGTITQENPAVYTAPYSLPEGGDVEVTAVWTEDESVDGSATLSISVPALELAIAQDTLWAGQETLIEATLVTDRTQTPDCKWYVNGVFGGDGDYGYGSISQDNPATYTAPRQAPADGPVVISAEWVFNETITGDSDILVKTPEVNLVLGFSRIQVDQSRQVSAYLSEAEREEDEFAWYVNNVLGGDEEVGTITQSNPATYTAPAAVPDDPHKVQIKAQWTELPIYQDFDSVTVVFTNKYVDAGTGVDQTPGGTIVTPFKTISFGLAHSSTGDTLRVAPGVYGPELGEDWPQTIQVKRTVRGANRDACIIDVDPAESALFYLYLNSVLENFTIRNLDYGTSSVNRCISIQGPATVRNLKFNEPFNHSAIRVENSGVVGIVEDCILDNTLAPGVERGMELISPAQAVIRNCTFSGWGRGIMATGTDEVTQVVENCEFVDNYRGVMVFGAESRVDLGGGAGGSLGGNTFSNNDIGLYSQTVHDVYALYNNWGEIPPVECGQESDAPCDFYTNNTGQIIWE